MPAAASMAAATGALMGAGTGPVGEVDGVGDAAQRQRLAHQIVAVARHRRRDFGGHDEAAGTQQVRKPRGAVGR